MAEPIEMAFGLLTWLGSRNHVLDGVQIPHGKVQFWGEKGGPLYSIGSVVHVPRRCRLMSNYLDHLLHFAWVVEDAKSIVVTRICVCVCLSVCLSAAACPHYCTDPDVTCGSGRGCLLVVHYWADLELVHGLRCCGNITRNA